MGVPPPQIGDDPAIHMMPELAPTRIAHTVRALSYRNFRLFTGGHSISLYSMTGVGLGPLGSLAAGALAGRFGARAAMAAGGVPAIASSLVFAWYLRRDPIAA
jgi:hypothetical protein